jgi:Ca2+-binding EF-hand superfamily protein
MSSRKRATFTAEQLENLRAVFSVLDTDGSGVISASELLAVLQRIDPTSSIHAAEAMIAEVDRDGDHVIHFDEFQKMMEIKLVEDAGVQEMVRLLGNDGRLSRAELRAALRRVDMIVSEDDVDEMLRSCDRGDKGFVDAGDLKAIFAGVGIDPTFTSPAGSKPPSRPRSLRTSLFGRPSFRPSAAADAER